MLISNGGTVIRMPVDGIKRAGRSTQGVIVMRLRDAETVSALAPVVESSEDGENGEAEVPAPEADPPDVYAVEDEDGGLEDEDELEPEEAEDSELDE